MSANLDALRAEQEQVASRRAAGLAEAREMAARLRVCPWDAVCVQLTGQAARELGRLAGIGLHAEDVVPPGVAVVTPAAGYDPDVSLVRLVRRRIQLAIGTGVCLGASLTFVLLTAAELLR